MNKSIVNYNKHVHVFLFIIYMYMLFDKWYNIMGGGFMAKTSAEMKNAYAKKAYDDVRLQVKKGTKQILQDTAEDKGMKLQSYVKYALKVQYKADTGKEIEL